MSPDDIGLLVLKIQDDDVLGSDMRKFIKTLMTDEEVRRNAKLVSSLSGLPEDVRQKHCRANILMLLTAGTLGPGPAEPSGRWSSVTKEFVKHFYICALGPWKAHMRADNGMTTTAFQAAASSAGRKANSTFPQQSVSETLAGHVRVIEEFWGVRGHFAA